MLRRHLLLGLTVGAPWMLAACNTVEPYRNVWDGLLPPGALPADSPVPIDGAAMRARSVAMVLSANFEDYIRRWVAHFERGGATDRQSLLADIGQGLGARGPLGAVGAGLSQGATSGLFDAALQANRQATDPRVVIDRVAGALKGHFAQVTVAADLAEARTKKVDHMAVVDLHFTANGMGDEFRYRGGLQMLDGLARRQFAIDVDVKSPRTMMDVSGAVAATQGLRAVSDQIVGGLARRLGT